MNPASNSSARKPKGETSVTPRRLTRPTGPRGRDTGDARDRDGSASLPEGHFVTETTRSYEHPGITDPVADEQPPGTVAFAKSIGAVATAATAAGDESPVATVDLAKELVEAGIEDVLRELDDELIGLAPVKTRIREIAALLLVERVRRKLGLSSEAPTLHMSFTGNPGTGKTTVALRMAHILHRLGFVRKGHLVSVTRDDLVGQYIGHTAPKTKEILKKAMGGVLFIDEAYYLYRPENERDYGQEAIEILLQVMEEKRDDLVVILAGYKDRMDIFFRSNPGIASRIAHHIDFPDYSQDELMSISELMLQKMHYRLSEDAMLALAEYIPLRRAQPLFANARSIRNALDRARLRQASRLVENGGCIGKEQLVRIAAVDVRQSRVFQGGLDGDAEA